MSGRTVALTEQAVREIRAMDAQVTDGYTAAAGHGDDLRERADQQARSLQHCLSKLLTGPSERVTVTYDYGLSLICVEIGGFTFGVNFHRDRSFDGTSLEGKFGTWSLNS